MSNNNSGPRLTPNLFGIAFGLAGVAQAWWTASSLFGVPPWVGNVLWLIVSLVWAAITAAYLRYLIRSGRLRTELADSTFSPFVSVALIVPMLCSVPLAAHDRPLGTGVFAISLALLVLLGALLIGEWIAAEVRLAQWHPGYFLPTVAGGFLGSAAAAQLGHATLAKLLFGSGAACWLILGSIILARLFTQPMLAVALRPTMAIEIAPAALGSVAWFGINGGRADALAVGLAGYGGLMLLAQVRLLPLYRAVPFGLPWWAFAFSYASVFISLLHWLSVEDVAQAKAWSCLLLVLVSAPIAVLAARTVTALARGTFLPESTPTPAQPPTPATAASLISKGTTS